MRLELHRGRSVSRSLLPRKFNGHLAAGAANKGQESKQLFFLLWTAENSDHALLSIINIWTFGLLYLPPNEKQRSALEGLACFRQWKPREGKKKKKALRIIQTICVAQGTWELCLNKLAIQKLRWCPACYLLMWHKMAVCQMKSCMEGRGGLCQQWG